ncbi:hypothetical protein QJR26_03530 [Clostridium baratii]
MKLKEIIKLELLELNINVSEGKVDLLINKFSSKVINYCHIDSVPKNLEQTIASMVIDFITSEFESNQEPELKSIQEGDTTLTFQSKTATSKLTIDKIMLNYAHELNSFRKPQGFK